MSGNRVDKIFDTSAAAAASSSSSYSASEQDHLTSVTRQTENFFHSCLAEITQIYTQTGKKANKGVSITNADELLASALSKFEAWNNSGFFKSNKNKLLADYVNEVINKYPNDHHHARMVFQLLQTCSESKGQSVIFPKLDAKQKSFLAALTTFDITANAPQEAMSKYQKFTKDLSTLTLYLDSLNKYSSEMILYQVKDAIVKNEALETGMAEKLFRATKGAGTSTGKELADIFMKLIGCIKAPNDKLFQITSEVMDAQYKDQIISPTEPFLRRTGIITDKLFEFCFNRSEKNLSHPGMQLLQEKILRGKGYEPDGNPHQNEQAVTNSIVEIAFKLSIAKESEQYVNLRSALQEKYLPKSAASSTLTRPSSGR